MVRINGEYVNIYQEVTDAIIRKKNLYTILNKIIEASIKDKDNSYLVRLMNPILNIEIHKEKIIREDENMDKEFYFAGKQGASLLFKMKATGQDDSYVIGITYKLLNALKKENIDDFLDVVMRLCNSLKTDMPTCFINHMHDKKMFKKIGYAFLTGLRGGIYNKENKEGGNNKKKRINNINDFSS